VLNGEPAWTVEISAGLTDRITRFTIVTKSVELALSRLEWAV